MCAKIEPQTLSLPVQVVNFPTCLKYSFAILAKKDEVAHVIYLGQNPQSGDCLFMNITGKEVGPEVSEQV